MSDNSAPPPDRRRNATPRKIDVFRGLDNANPPAGLAFQQLTEAINIHLDNTGMLISRRDGVILYVDVADAFGHRQLPFFAVIDTAGNLSTHDTTTLERIITLGNVGGPPYVWGAVAGAALYLQSMTGSWVITATRLSSWGVPTHPGPAALEVLPTQGRLRAGVYLLTLTYLEIGSWREGGAVTLHRVDVATNGSAIRVATEPAPYHVQVYLSTADGAEVYRAYTVMAGQTLTVRTLPREVEEHTAALAEPIYSLGCYPPPLGAAAIAFWGNRMVVGVNDATNGAGAVYWSLPYQYGLFRLARDHLAVPGEIRVLAESPAGLVVGTDRQVLLLGEDEMGVRPLLLAGCPPGNAADHDLRGNLYIQTHRGPARVSGEGLALLAETVRDDYTGPAALAVVEEGGFERLVVAYGDGPGEVFNPLPEWVRDVEVIRVTPEGDTRVTPEGDVRVVA